MNYEIKEFDSNLILELVDNLFLRLKKFDFPNNSLKIDDIIVIFKNNNIEQIDISLKKIEEDISKIEKNSKNIQSKDELKEKLNIFYLLFNLISNKEQTGL